MARGVARRRWLAPEYRRALVVRELLGYHADVLCLQEVDESFFTKSLRSHLDGKGAPCAAPAAPPAARTPRGLRQGALCGRCTETVACLAGRNSTL